MGQVIGSKVLVDYATKQCQSLFQKLQKLRRSYYFFLKYKHLIVSQNHIFHCDCELSEIPVNARNSAGLKTRVTP